MTKKEAREIAQTILLNESHRGLDLINRSFIAETRCRISNEAEYKKVRAEITDIQDAISRLLGIS